VPSLVRLYILLILLIIGSYLLKIPVSAMMLLVNQNFIFIYAFIIIAYWKTETSWLKWVFSVISLVSLSFLISGFTWKIAYPIFLIGFGYFRFLRSTDKISISKNPASGNEIARREDVRKSLVWSSTKLKNLKGNL